MRTLFTLALLISSTAVAAQVLPDAPSATLIADVGSAGVQAGAPVPDTVMPNPLPLVNGRHYRSLTESERLSSFALSLVSPGIFGGTLYSATYRQLRDRPAPQYWNTDAEGFGKRVGAAYGQRVIERSTRYTFGVLLREDNRYLVCHGCTIGQKLRNALLADFTARHGADGHRTFSPTGIAAGFSGSLVAYAFWYPNQDPNFTVQRGARNSLIGFGTRPATHFAVELLDGHKVPFLHKKFWESPKRVQQVPVGWTGPMPPKRRQDPAIPDVPGGYADPPDPPLPAK